MNDVLILVDEQDKEIGTEEWAISSAGTWTKDGEALPGITRQLAVQMGLPGIDNHRTRQVDDTILKSADLVIVMESNQREALVSEFPEVQARIFMLSEIVEAKPYDIPDPASGEVSSTEVANELVRLIKTGAPKIISLARELAMSRTK